MSLLDLSVLKAFTEAGHPQDGKLRNLICYKSDIVFLWDDIRSRLLVQDIKLKDHQEIIPTNIPIFEITFISVNEIMTKAVLWGVNGILIINLPQRWGPQSGFEGGKKSILARSEILLDSGPKILRVKYHPELLLDNHILILGTDNVIYVYSLEANSAILVTKYVLGKRSSSRQPFLESLGDTAVDFSFAPCMSEEATIHPILILRGNGDVCWIPLKTNWKSDFCVLGPLPVTPSADDNYGVDAYSILVTNTFPPAVIIAASTGVIYHSILLPLDSLELSKPPEIRNYRLHVLESLSLDLGFPIQNDDQSINCSVILQEDPICRRRYFATHATGVHSISLHVLLDIEELIEQPLFQMTKKSVAEYLICTSADNKLENPVIGFAIAWTNILVILSSGDIVERQVRQLMDDIETPVIKTTVDGPITSALKKSKGFEQNIIDLVNLAKAMPLFKISQPDSDYQQSLLLLLRYTKIIRENYFQPLKEARDILNKRTTLLKGLLEVQMLKMNSLESEKMQLQTHAEEMADKMEVVLDNLEVLTRRVQNVILLTSLKYPMETTAEIEMRKDVSYIEERLEGYKKTVQKLKDSQAYQNLKIGNSNPNKDIKLSMKQSNTIMTSLKEMSENIATLVKQINVLKKNVKSFDDVALYNY